MLLAMLGMLVIAGGAGAIHGNRMYVLGVKHGKRMERLDREHRYEDFQLAIRTMWIDGGREASRLRAERNR